MTGMRKFWVSLIWGLLLIVILIVLLLVKNASGQPVLTEGMFIAWITSFGGVFVFFITGNVFGDHLFDGAMGVSASMTPPSTTAVPTSGAAPTQLK